jgi:hypothetical protein
MNAVSFFRLFSRLFLGKRRTGFTVMADALPRERWILTGIVLFLVLGGLFPNATVIEHSSEVDVVDQSLLTIEACRLCSMLGSILDEATTHCSVANMVSQCERFTSAEVP